MPKFWCHFFGKLFQVAKKPFQNYSKRRKNVLKFFGSFGVNLKEISIFLGARTLVNENCIYSGENFVKIWFKKNFLEPKILGLAFFKNGISRRSERLTDRNDFFFFAKKMKPNF